MKINRQTRKKSAISLLSTAKLRGDLAIFLTYTQQDGSVDRVPYFEEKNVITLLAMQKVLSGIYLSTTSDPITTLQVGTGGTLDSEGLYPRAVNQSLTSLYSYLLTVPVTYSIAPTVPSVTFLATVDESTANGSNLNEAGLFTQAGVMFNIKTWPSITKASSFGVQFEWTISIA
jgi:hypothetical protein